MSTWELLSAAPKPVEKAFFSSLNDEEMLLVDIEGLWKYHCFKHQWQRIMKMPENLTRVPRAGVIDKDAQSFYFCTQKGELFKVDINNKNISVLCQHKNFDDHIMFKRDHNIHLITRKLSNETHMIFNESVKCIHREKYPISAVRLSFPAVIMNKRNSMIRFGVKSHGMELVEYSFTKKTWENYQSAEYFFFASEIVISSDERYLILLGSYEHKMSRHSKDIVVLDFKTMELRESLVKLPVENVMINMHNNEFGKNLLIFGYVNELWKSSEYSYVPSLPIYLIRLIGKCMHIEYVHIIKADKNTSLHWRINVDDILK